MIYVGWHSSKCTNSSRSEGLCPGSADLTTIANPHALHSSHILFPAQHVTRCKFIFHIESQYFITSFLGWNSGRARCNSANPFAPHFGTAGKTWLVPDRGWSDDILVGWPRCCTATHNGCLQSTELRGSTRRQGGHLYVLRVSSIPQIADPLLANRRRFLFLTTSSHSGSTLSSRKRAKCAEASIIPICMWLKRMVNRLCGSGLSAASYKIVPMFYRAISSSLDN